MIILLRQMQTQALYACAASSDTSLFCSIHVPPGITLKELGIIKITAQVVVRHVGLGEESGDEQ